MRLEAFVVLGEAGGAPDPGTDPGGCILSILGLGEELMGPLGITGRVGWGRAGNIRCDALAAYCWAWGGGVDSDSALAALAFEFDGEDDSSMLLLA